MSVVRVNQIQDTSTNVAANISGGVVTFVNPPQGTGKLLQTVTTGYIATHSALVTSTTQASLISLSITPSSTSSKILILCQSNMEIIAGSSALIGSNLYRGTLSGTKIGEYYSGKLQESSGNTSYVVISYNILDAPSTTNATTYTVGFATGSGGTTSVKGHAIGRQLTLMEIGA
tara:strand:+ start:156 stop:677 length:522 start_codon:yes stop_codon:yes gene_type:complete